MAEDLLPRDTPASPGAQADPLPWARSQILFGCNWHHNSYNFWELHATKKWWYRKVCSRQAGPHTSKVTVSSDQPWQMGDMQQYSFWLWWCWLNKWNTSKTMCSLSILLPRLNDFYAPFSLSDRTLESMLCFLFFLWCKQQDTFQFPLFGASPAMDFLLRFSWDGTCTDQQCEACPSPRNDYRIIHFAVQASISLSLTLQVFWHGRRYTMCCQNVLSCSLRSFRLQDNELPDHNKKH